MVHVTAYLFYKLCGTFRRNPCVRQRWTRFQDGGRQGFFFPASCNTDVEVDESFISGSVRMRRTNQNTDVSRLLHGSLSVRGTQIGSAPTLVRQSVDTAEREAGVSRGEHAAEQASLCLVQRRHERGL